MATEDTNRRAPGVAPLTPLEEHRNRVIVENRLDALEAAAFAAGAVSPDGQTRTEPVNGQMNWYVDNVLVGHVNIDGSGIPKWTLTGILDPAAYAGTPQTIAQRNALVATSPLLKAGYLVYVVDGATKEYQVWDGAAWAPVGSGGASVTIANNLTTNSASQALAAAQGVVIAARLDALEEGTDGGTATSVF